MLNVIKNTHITRNLTATDAEGQPYSVVSFTGQVHPEKSMSFSMTVSDPDAAMANSTAVVATLDDFMAELRSMAGVNGLPV